MGIDVYMRWHGQTEDERQAQYTGFATNAGKVGYLREAYHGTPYATKILCPEGFADSVPENGVHVPLATLTARLPEVLHATLCRDLMLYQGKSPADLGSFGGDDDPIAGAMKAIGPMIAARLKASALQSPTWLADIPQHLQDTAGVQVALGYRLGWWPDFAQSYIDFVAFYANLDGAGKHPTIIVSY